MGLELSRIQIIRVINRILTAQGGKRQERNDDLVIFPIAFQQKVLGIQATKGLGVNAPSYKDVTLRNFKLYSHDNRGYYTTWLAIGS